MLRKHQELGPDYWLENGLARHTLVEPQGLIHCDNIWDVGAGIRPMQWYDLKRHICVEPYEPYAKKLSECGFQVIQETALVALRRPETVEAIYLLDVIEHMEKDEGKEVVELAKTKASVQVVVFTPNGFMEQDEDAWGMSGDYWQTHKSGWTRDDFKGWRFQPYGKMFFATYDV